VTDPSGSPHAQRDDLDALFDERTDPAGSAFATLGQEASSELNWIKLIRHKVRRRAMGSSRYQWWVLWSLLAGLFALNFTFTVFNVDLLKISEEFHAKQSVITWTTIGPVLAFGLAAPIFGKWGDVFGHRRLYIFGLLGGMVAAILTALAPNVELLIFARTLDGIQGAATGTASGALLNLVFSREERVKAAGWWSLVGAGGPVIGLSLGAPIITAWGWRSLFWIQLGMLVIACAVVATILPARVRPEAEEEEHRIRARREFRQMDWIGSWTISLSITALMLGISIADSVGWLSWQCNLCWLFFVGLLAGFVVRINHAENPLIPPHYFKRRNFVFPMVARSASNFAYFGAFWLSSLLLQYAYHKSPTQVGAIVIARPIVFAIASPIAGYVAVKIGERTSAVMGSVFLVASMLVFASLGATGWEIPILIALALSGLGMGVAMPSNGATMANEVDPKEFGVMTAAQLLTGQAGQVLGLGVLVALQQATYNELTAHQRTSTAEVLTTFHTPFIVAACVGCVAVAASAMFRSLPRGHSRGDLAEADDHAL